MIIRLLFSHHVDALLLSVFPVCILDLWPMAFILLFRSVGPHDVLP